MTNQTDVAVSQNGPCVKIGLSFFIGCCPGFSMSDPYVPNGQVLASEPELAVTWVKSTCALSNPQPHPQPSLPPTRPASQIPPQPPQQPSYPTAAPTASLRRAVGRKTRLRQLPSNCLSKKHPRGQSDGGGGSPISSPSLGLVCVASPRGVFFFFFFFFFFKEPR